MNGKKLFNFQNFYTAAEMLQHKLHLTIQELTKIKIIQEEINNNDRLYNMYLKKIIFMFKLDYRFMQRRSMI